MNDQHPAHALQQPSAFDDPSPLQPAFSRAAEGQADVSTGLLGDSLVNALISTLREADAEPDSRSAAIISLVGIVEFLKNIPEIEQYDLHSTIWKLAVALKDIDRGVISPIFSDPYAGISNRREQGSDIRIIKAYSSYCVELLMHVGIGLDVACRHVADGLSKAGFKIKGKVNTPPWRTVRGWREGLSKLSPDDNPERSTVDGLRANDSVTDGMTHAQAVQHVAGLLKLLVRKTVT